MNAEDSLSFLYYTLPNLGSKSLFSLSLYLSLSISLSLSLSLYLSLSISLSLSSRMYMHFLDCVKKMKENASSAAKPMLLCKL